MVRNEKSEKFLDLKYIFSTVVAFLIVVSLARMIWDNLESLRRVKNLRSEAELMEAHNQQLKSELEERKSLEYVEEQARQKIGMVKEGEKVLIYPNEKQDAGQMAGAEYIEGDLCYWCEWLNAFGF